MYRHILCNIHNIRLRPPRGLNLEPYFPILSEILSIIILSHYLLTWVVVSINLSKKCLISARK